MEMLAVVGMVRDVIILVLVYETEIRMVVLVRLMVMAVDGVGMVETLVVVMLMKMIVMGIIIVKMVEVGIIMLMNYIVAVIVKKTNFWFFNYYLLYSCNYENNDNKDLNRDFDACEIVNIDINCGGERGTYGDNSGYVGILSVVDDAGNNIVRIGHGYVKISW